MSFDFDECFELITGNSPFHWQKQLFEEMKEGKFPDICDIPTGLGKTSVITIWLLALVHSLSQEKSSRKIPIRLVYVVDRRVIVDQSTEEAEKIIKAMNDAPENSPLKKLVNIIKASTLTKNGELIALSSLRGQKADNREWCLDPSRPAIIIGTVDMIGSRLLFSGYGRVGKNHKSLQAGLLGQDALVLIDEAHLSPVFVKTIRAIEKAVTQDFKSIRPFKIIQLSATVSSQFSVDKEETNDVLKKFEFNIEEESKNEIPRRRLYAQKKLEWLTIEHQPNKNSSNRKKEIEAHILEKVVTQAIQYKDNAVSVIIFLETVKLVNATYRELSKHIENPESRILRMTGEMRGAERDEFFNPENKESNKESKVVYEIFSHFLPKRKRPIDKTYYLIATSCAEIGIDLDADYGICDLSSLDSMIQRFGRINRFGLKSDSALISVVVDLSSIQATEFDIQQKEQGKNKLEEQDLKIEELEQDKKKAEAELKNTTTKEEKSGLKEKIKQINQKLKEEEKLKKTLGKENSSKNEFEHFERIKHEKYYSYLLLNATNDMDVSPLSLRSLATHILYPKAFPSEPITPVLDRAIIDDWSMTSFKPKEYPKPLVSYWLRGVTYENETVQTSFCWRADLMLAKNKKEAEEMIKLVPIEISERAVLATHRAEETITKLAKRFPEERIVIIDMNGEVESKIFGEWFEENNEQLFLEIAYSTIVFPCSVQGLARDGNVSEDSKHEVPDVLESKKNNKWSRFILLKTEDGTYKTSSLSDRGKYVEDKESEELNSFLDAMEDRKKRAGKEWLLLDYLPVSNFTANTQNQDIDDIDEFFSEKYILYFFRKNLPEKYLREEGDEISSYLNDTQTIDDHNGKVGNYAGTLIEYLGLNSCLETNLNVQEAFYKAGSNHDLGKNRDWWQAAIGNPKYPESTDWKALAKTIPNKHHKFDHQLNKKYRHEFGSLVDFKNVLSKNDLGYDLILHLIASHHGYARPHFPIDSYDRNNPKGENQKLVEETMNRFAQLQRTYGWWQLAYLEALLKCADALASRDFERENNEK